MDKLLNAEETAQRLNTTPDRVYAMARQGLIPAVHMGRLVRFSEPVLDEWIRSGGRRLADSTGPVRGGHKRADSIEFAANRVT